MIIVKNKYLLQKKTQSVRFRHILLLKGLIKAKVEKKSLLENGNTEYCILLYQQHPIIILMASLALVFYLKAFLQLIQGNFDYIIITTLGIVHA